MEKYTSCLICKSTHFQVIHRKEPWEYIQCQNCRLVSLHPKPDGKGVLNNYDTYLPVHLKEIDKWRKMMKPVIDTSAELILSRCGSGTRNLLDIGCGFGFFLNDMKSRGWSVKGIEISKTGREYAEKHLYIEVYSKPLEELALPENYFDVITLFYVIEHVLDVSSLLKKVNRILKPGGLILLRWPHTTPIVKFLGPLASRMDLYHTPYHLYDFSKQTMERLLDATGFESIETVIGGYTLPPSSYSRWPSFIFGNLGELLFFVSRGRFLFPGVSKTTLATKPVSS